MVAPVTIAASPLGATGTATSVSLVTGGGVTTIRVAVVQAQSLPGQIQANLDHAAGLVDQAAAQGASIVVLPELFSCGYVPNRAVWEAAEARRGQTDR